MGGRIVIGTRGSMLALVQAGQVRDLLQAALPDHEVSLRLLASEGDLDRSRPLSRFEGRGVFVKSLERALLAGEVDCCVHSMKDVPPVLAPGLVIGAVPVREDVRDALITRGSVPFAELGRGARVATGSLRRRVQLARLRDDLVFVDVRGNLDTRLAKLDQGRFDALVVAAAGMHRLGRGGRIAEYLPVDVSVPAPGQGAIGVEVRADDEGMLRACQLIDDPALHRDVGIERELMCAHDADCSLPFGTYARMEQAADAVTSYRIDLWLLTGGLLRSVRVSGREDEAGELACEAAMQLAFRPGEAAPPVRTSEGC